MEGIDIIHFPPQGCLCNVLFGKYFSNTIEMLLKVQSVVKGVNRLLREVVVAPTKFKSSLYHVVASVRIHFMWMGPNALAKWLL